MNVSTELLPPGARLLRIGAEDWNDDGPYCIKLVVVSKGDDLIIKGLDKTMKPSHWKAIIQWADEQGYDRLLFSRKRAGKEIQKVVQVKRK